MRYPSISELASILLGALALIPHHMLRYTLVAITIIFLTVLVTHFQRPSNQLLALRESIRHAEETIHEVQPLCTREVQVGLAELGVRLLEVRQAALIWKCRLLETDRLTWRKYWLMRRRIQACVLDVKNIRTAIQVLLESEHELGEEKNPLSPELPRSRRSFRWAIITPTEYVQALIDESASNFGRKRM
ncbi:hypothetical protein FB45DRAFT_1038936 [Roridomyces roridus]|uniref:Uncharacterized protein n=1 Tax=Roridomyces roridus TaxID=1738132 RepID=A0AAD7B462_9AGAR|nr:hypothetical protein FB45DRAFT_1038936 [Roridomyces roridus]